MASENMKHHLGQVSKDLISIQNSQQFRQASSNPAFAPEFARSVESWNQKFTQATEVLDNIDDMYLQPLAAFGDQIVNSINNSLPQNQTYVDAIRNVKNSFIPQQLSFVSYGIYEALGVFNLTEGQVKKWYEQGLANVNAKVESAKDEIQKKADEVLEGAYRTASKVSVKAAQDEFMGAARMSGKRSTVWLTLSVIFSVSLLLFLVWHLIYPPQLIREITESLKPASGGNTAATSVSVPLLVAGAAYFTSIRLAIAGVLGAALAFSIRMARAYLHMTEFNLHRIRVTNSIEAFVAAFHTNEQQDIALSKLVESITQFGDSGILAKPGEPPSSLPSVVVDSITKNVGKID